MTPTTQPTTPPMSTPDQNKPVPTSPSREALIKWIELGYLSVTAKGFALRHTIFDVLRSAGIKPKNDDRNKPDENPTQDHLRTGCQGGKCPHRSDCAVHNEPAFPAGPCDCGHDLKAARRYVAYACRLARIRLGRLQRRIRSRISLVHVLLLIAIGIQLLVFALLVPKIMGRLGW